MWIYLYLIFKSLITTSILYMVFSVAQLAGFNLRGENMEFKMSTTIFIQCSGSLTELLTKVIELGKISL